MNHNEKVYMIDKLKERNNRYQTCGKKVVFGKSMYDYDEWSVPLRKEFQELQGGYWDPNKKDHEFFKQWFYLL